MVNESLRKYAKSNLSVAADATDDVIESAVQKALQGGNLTGEKYAELLSEKDPDPVSVKDELIKGIGDAVAEKIKGEKMLSENDILGQAVGTGGSDTRIRVKGLDERYSTKRYEAKHARTGRPVVYRGAPLEHCSEYEAAKVGAFLKWKAHESGIQCGYGDHEKSLLAESIEHDTWIGVEGTEETGVTKAYSGSGLKALLDDGSSGGQHLSPEYFDENIVVEMLLHSEVLPHVDMVDVPRGSTIGSAKITPPTVVWGTAEGTSQDLFDTTSLISDIASTVFGVAAFIEIGRDFMQDAAINVGKQVMTATGERVQQELDRVVCDGDGSTQPQGIMQASGTTDITPGTPTTGPLTSTDMLNLMFGVAKQYRVPSIGPRYIMTDETYKDLRSISTGVTGDDRLLFGKSVQSYEIHESPVSIEQQGLSNTELIFGALKKYRLWRRQGVQMQFSTEGATNMRKNVGLLAIRGRYAGEVVDPSGFATMDSAPV